jgi:hypothetical protein
MDCQCVWENPSIPHFAIKGEKLRIVNKNQDPDFDFKMNSVGLTDAQFCCV